MNLRRYIEVKFTKSGVHCYPAAATDPSLATGDQYDVSFLANPHFHYFHFVVIVEVFHDDRDLEFIQFERWCQNQYADGTLELNSKSCEMLGEELLVLINARYPNRYIKVSVFEDNINGGHVEYDPLALGN